MVAKKLKSNTIRSYISAIKSVLKDDGVTVNEDKYLLASLTKACRYRNDHQVKIRLPIKRQLFECILYNTFKYFQDNGQEYLNKLYRAMFAVSYYGMLRISEITFGSHPILARDVHIATNKNKLLFVLRTSKTHWKDNKPQLVKISKNSMVINTDDPLSKCPYHIIREYLSVRPLRENDSETFFVFSDGSPVYPSQIRTILKIILKQAGFEPSYYGFHGFRIGRCLDLNSLGISVETIKFLGRWTSNCVYTYLRNL